MEELLFFSCSRVCYIQSPTTTITTKPTKHWQSGCVIYEVKNIRGREVGIIFVHFTIYWKHSSHHFRTIHWICKAVIYDYHRFARNSKLSKSKDCFSFHLPDRNLVQSIWYLVYVCVCCVLFVNFSVNFYIQSNSSLLREAETNWKTDAKWMNERRIISNVPRTITLKQDYGRTVKSNYISYYIESSHWNAYAEFFYCYCCYCSVTCVGIENATEAIIWLWKKQYIE